MRRWMMGLLLVTLSGGCGVTSSVARDENPAEATAPSVVEAEAPRGFCDKNEVRYPVEARSADIRACYEEQLKRVPGLSGRVETSWRLGEDGRVIEVTTTGPEELAACVAAVIRSIAFRPPPLGCEVVTGYPFLFSAE